ncbi:hypothetical protein RHSIM_Rhsim09G0143100 [Rhododendron simsii]|uniref:Root cap n=1 Tax=Rhododendron simsii TaxID=118357 RepID=A0A834LFX0_RHOSS|nr:hypothetical protein RHSIM_Rhsim09G0143100 [Rhododendron simsii]
MSVLPKSPVSMRMSLVVLFMLWFSATATAAIQPRIVRCRRQREFPLCFNVPAPCPPACLRTCFMDCATCRPVCRCNTPGAVCEDPRFVGGDGITFYFHGRKNQDFCLVSDSDLHINAHFIGKRNPNLNRDFTWVQSIGILINNHKLLVAAKKTSKWDDDVDRLAIFLDNNPISLPAAEGSEWKSPAITATRTAAANRVTIEAPGAFRVTAAVVPITPEESKVHGYNITDDDCFAHLELGFKFYNLTDSVDGVLGQTYRSDYVSKAKVNMPMQVMGGANKYLTSHIFATDCLASRFGSVNPVSSSKNRGTEYSTMKCSTGVDGGGVVCKR